MTVGTNRRRDFRWQAHGLHRRVALDLNRTRPLLLMLVLTVQELLDDPLIPGERHKRVDEDRYNAITIDNFVTTVEKLFP